MLSATSHDQGGEADDPDLSIAFRRPAATFCTPKFYIYSIEIAIHLRVVLIPVFLCGLRQLMIPVFC